MFDDDVWRYLPMGFLPTLVAGVVVLGLLVAVSLRSSPRMRWLAVLLLILTTLAIVVMTLSGGAPGPDPGSRVSLQPGAGIRSEFEHANLALGVVIVLGNIVVFMPFGWLIAVLARYAPSVGVLAAVGRGALAGLVFSLLIEMTQFFVGRVSDVDDLLLNTAGALLGALIGAALTSSGRRSGPPAVRYGPVAPTHA